MGKAVSHRILEILLDLLKMSAALLIVAASVYFFLIPSGASVSSISGLAIILQHFTGRSISELTMLLNIALLLLGFLTCGRNPRSRMAIFRNIVSSEMLRPVKCRRMIARGIRPWMWYPTSSP